MEPVRRRSFVFSKRLNIGIPERPQSLISYEPSTAPAAPVSSINLLATQSGGAKAVPPVLARARAQHLNVVLPVAPSDPVNNATNRRTSFGPLEELVICAICLERLSIPKMLTCQHTFCLSCLLSQLDIKDLIRCPTCRAEQRIASKNDVENLPSNLYIDSLLNLLKDNPQSPSNLQVCILLSC